MRVIVAGVHVAFGKRTGGGSVATIDRPDGVQLRLWSYDRKYPIPHDLAHFVAEREFRLAGGIWGCIAAGAVFGSMEVVSGRLRHDRHRRSKAVLRANAAEIGRAEVLAGLVHVGVELDDREIGRRLAQAWGVFGDSGPPPAARAVEAVGELRRVGRLWTELPPDGTLSLTWPLGPARSADSGPRPGVRRGRRGRH